MGPLRIEISGRSGCDHHGPWVGEHGALMYTVHRSAIIHCLQMVLPPEARGLPLPPHLRQCEASPPQGGGWYATWFRA